ncbi:hypothetical protein [Gillisia sp. Hel_I_29]|uniref:hypothetical protein n=1 Tax=Gillisia sp. Hel_I_29 TaxID=1249975 RepID=UPI00054F92ED|nr:hypothetical protein [Gillisia sp. Hel_I_29]
MKESQLKIIFEFLSIFLLITLIYKITQIPGGMIMPGILLGSILIIGVIISSLIITTIFYFILRRKAFIKLFAIISTFSFLGLHYYFYSPTLEIIVPNGYSGKINLVLSDVDENILKVDKNGIGYLNEWTFNKTYSKPIVRQVNGQKLENYAIGFNSSSFFAKEKSCCIGNKEIESLSFKIENKSNKTLEEFKSRNLINLVDKNKILLKEKDTYSTINTKFTKQKSGT